MLEQSQLHAIEARCTQEAAPRCRTACPLDMDVRSFLECLAAGRTRDARKFVERHLPLPAVLTAVCDHPCENACLRRDLGGSLAVSALEKFCMKAAPQQSRPLIRPPKAQNLAVLGAGLAGLTAAFDISHKGFSVTVYHEGPREEAMQRAFPALDAAPLAEELNALEKFHVRFVSAPLSLELLKECEKNFTAVFVDASLCAFAPVREETDPITLLWHGKVCVGGWESTTPTGARFASASGQAGEGRKAGITLQRVMTGVSLVASREGEERKDKLHTPLDGVAPLARVLPSEGGYTEGQAREEASRCIRCACMQCVKECPFLQKYKEFPRVYARKLYNNASVVRGTRTANVIMNGCALCGQCEVICPEHFSMADLCLAARRDAVERDVMPVSAHEFALEDMAQASGPEASFFLEDPAFAAEGRHGAAMFFPGCQLAASRGEQVLAMYRYLRASLPGGVSLYSSCCGIPAHWAGREGLFASHAETLRAVWEKAGRPEILTACSSCMSALALALPEASVVSLWEKLDHLLPSSFPSAAPKVMNVQDPCGARRNEAWRNAVRSLAAKAGITVEEAARTGAESACCGYGGLVWNAQPDVADAMAEKRTGEFSRPVLASCIMCHDRFAERNESWHLFDILPPTAGEGEARAATPPGLSARRAGRIALKDAALEEFLGQKSAPHKESILLRIPEEVRKSMERRYILRQDVLAAIAGIEGSGAKFLNRENGHFLGSWRPRNVTFWVEYTADDDGGFTLVRAWCHRMVVPGAIQPATKVIMEERVHA
ncbi:pyridine nucleotide-disulfide oxidoreductase/dicluster-binding protein [Mailhella massiliensis]|uniref:4Fe-4S dicluster domain-containing protein n=1 Tax=Mailhella massiliensis TaxID=1903261 RepID=A0A921AV31_9BACT|nr:pyridine nucleotide-disulfide oxidoreductase/dicluster-binding protein [Mailhella massiliensis]HJD96611.1 4Fe-4S dicluster domain-containing protein [Mailhella massiliensis]